MRKKITRAMATIICVMLFVGIMTFSAFAKSTTITFTQSQLKTVKRSNSTLADGVTQDLYTTYDKNGQQVKMYVATADMNVESVKLFAAYKNMQNDSFGMATLTEQIDSFNQKAAAGDEYYQGTVVAGINASYYNMSNGQPIGAFVMNGNDSTGTNTPGGWGYFAVMKDGSVKIGKSSEYATDAGNIQEAVGIYDGLIYNGEIVPNLDDEEKYPRQTIGITADNKVIIMTADGAQAPTSCGLTYLEQAQVMADLGCVYAGHLDGGGSATYGSKAEGEDGFAIVNKPSDGSARRVSNSLFIVSQTEQTNAFSRVAMSTDYKCLTPGTSVDISLKGVSASGNSATIPNDVEYTVENGTYADGKITATAVGDVTITATYEGNEVGSYTLHAVIPDSIAFSSDNIVMPYGKSGVLEIKATYEGNNVVTKESDFTLSLETPAAGSLSGLAFSAGNDQAITGTNITATFVGTSVTTTSTITLGRGSEYVADFDTQEDVDKWMIGSYDDTSAKNAGIVDQTVTYVTKENGIVHDGDGAMKVELDFLKSGVPAANNTYVELFPLDNIILEGAKTIGAWVYIPDEMVDFKLGLYVWCPYNTASQNYETNFGFDKCVNNGAIIGPDNLVSFDESGWHYISIDVSAYEKTLLTGWNDFYAKKTTDRDRINRVRFLQFQLVAANKVSWGGTYGSLDGNFTIYIDSITADYSSTVVADREAPTINNMRLNSTTLPKVSNDNSNTIVKTNSSNLNIYADVAEDTSKTNATGLDLSSAKAYIDGKEVSCNVSNGVMSITDFNVADGVHRIKFKISDKAGNETVRERMVEVETGATDATVSLVADDATLNYLYGGSVYWMDLTSNKIEAIQSVKTTIDINSMNHWELDHMEVVDGFEASYTLDEENNSATITLTRTGTNEETGSGVLAKLPIRIVSYETDMKLANVTAEAAWTKASHPHDLKVDVDYGEYTYVSNDESDLRTTFSNENFSVKTERYAFKSAMEKNTEIWSRGTHHVHTAKAVDDLAPTCTKDGYTGRTYCDVCKSIVDWGTTIAATGHTYEIKDGKTYCVDCKEDIEIEGLTEINGKYYFGYNGSLKKGWREVDEAMYYFGDDYAAVTGVQTINNVTYEFDTDGKLKHGVWVKTLYGTRYYYGENYYKCGSAASVAFHEIEGKTYGFNNKGYMLTGSVKAYESNGPMLLYDFDENGIFLGNHNGIYQNKYYVDGALKAVGLVKIGDDYYYFKGSGAYVTGAYSCTNMNDLLPAGTYTFGDDGKMLQGLVNDYYYVNGKLSFAGMISIEGDYYYIDRNGKMSIGTIKCEKTNDLLPSGTYTFGEDGKMLNGLVEKTGKIYYYENSKLKAAGLVKVENDYYYIRGNGTAVTGSYYCTNMNDLLPAGTYTFGDDGKMQNGLVKKDGKLYYYENSKLKAAGLVKVGNDYYYIRGNGTAVTGSYYCTNMNGLLPVGTYTFADDCKMLNGLIERSGTLYYYENSKLKAAGLVKVGNDYYYIRGNGTAVVGTYNCTNMNNLLPAGTYTFGTDGKMTELSNGLVEKSGTLYYYEGGKLVAKGLICVDGDYYYIKGNGTAVTGTYFCTNNNGISIPQYYKFGDDGKWIK